MLCALKRKTDCKFLTESLIRLLAAYAARIHLPPSGKACARLFFALYSVTLIYAVGVSSLAIRDTKIDNLVQALPASYFLLLHPEV